ncbi:alpha/beta hydrolase [Hyphomonas sp.]|uniref:alpha/beta hydrolase n=1 Tax=Hyphomonas sp. TaxID=87 RepID=UPI0025C54A28|nr:alpha/beta hydrolase [Hyphomonas sp.]MBI1401569.1 alpha/beta fold hydrolase [Hyphomonas sp.]
MPTLLMIHGIGCDGSAWDVMKPGFEAAGWTCEAITLFPDRRVRENPPASLPELGFADFVEAAAAEARRLTARDGAKPAVIGHSMGGLIAQVLAERGEVSKAVFLTPAQPKGCAAIGLPVAWTFLNIILRQDRKRSYKVWKTGFSWGVLNLVPKERHDAIYATALYDSGKVYGDMTDGIEVDERKVTIPTLTIAGSQDRATLPKGVRKVAAKYAASPVKGEFIEYPNHAHWIVDEPGTDKVVADIAGWLGLAA